MARSPGRVFVAGATGVVGRRAVSALVGAGHRVSGVARSEAAADRLRALGVSPVGVSLFDRAALAAAMAGHDVVCNLATSIPPLRRAAVPGAWADNDRIRREGSRALVGAALDAGATTFVQESITFTYADGGDAWLDEDAPLAPAAQVRSAPEAEAQARRFDEAEGRTGVVLRFAAFYGPDSSHSIDALRLARRGWAMALGAADGYVSSVATADAAAAVVAALDAPGGTYNVGDDEPLTRRDWADALARAVGRSRLRLPPGAVGKVTGPLGRSQRVSNRRLRAATGWVPQTPSARVGWPAVAAAL